MPGKSTTTKRIFLSFENLFLTEVEWQISTAKADIEASNEAGPQTKRDVLSEREGWVKWKPRAPRLVKISACY